MEPIESPEALRRRLARIAWLLDSAIQIPGTRFRIGIDAIVGLVPGLGDAIGVLLSSYIIREAARAGVPAVVLVHMAWNVAIEGIVGIIPFAGDVFDAAWKANQRNVALLERHLNDPRKAKRSSGLFIAALTLGLIAMVTLAGVATYFVVRAAVHAFGG